MKNFRPNVQSCFKNEAEQDPWRLKKKKKFLAKIFYSAGWGFARMRVNLFGIFNFII